MKPRESKISQHYLMNTLRTLRIAATSGCSGAAQLHSFTWRQLRCFCVQEQAPLCSSYQGKMLHFSCSRWDGYWLGLGQINNNKNEFVALVLFLSGEQGCSEQRRTSGSNLWVASSSLVAHQAGLVLPRKAQCQHCSGQGGLPTLRSKAAAGRSRHEGEPTWAEFTALWSSSSTPVTFNLEIYKTVFMFCSGLKCSLEIC